MKNKKLIKGGDNVMRIISKFALMTIANSSKII
jgi:hypothetical protein